MSEPDHDDFADEDQHESLLMLYSEGMEDAFPKDVLLGDVGEAAYAYSERGAFIDGIDIKDPLLMIQIWAIVERIRIDGGFPQDLRM